jgi:2,3-dihydroxybiphenyl 1,2-dioxygenase
VSHIRNLAYIGIGSDDQEAWKKFAVDILGLQVGLPPTSCVGDSSLYLRLDTRSFRLAVEPGVSGAVHFLGFEVATSKALADAVEHLRDAGVDVAYGSAEDCARRRVKHMAIMCDPYGTRLELAVGHEEATLPFISPTGATFVTDDMGLGHVLFTVPNVTSFVDFYVDLLGFGLSDTVDLASGIEGYFLHCNSRHHTVAAIEVADQPARLNHVMIEVSDLDTLGRAYDKSIKNGIPIPGTLGKHTNDHMLSFYCNSPSGFDIEYGIGGRRIDVETWVSGHYTAASYWGHARPSDPRP